MREIKRWFLEMLKRFFKPVFARKKISVKWIIPALWISIIWIIIVYLLKDITNNISEWLYNETMKLLYIFIFFIILNYFLILLTRQWTHSVMRPKYREYMYGKFIPKYTFLDNNEAEKLWTGKLIAMIDKWMHAWVDLVVRFFVDILPWIIFIILSFFFIWFIDISYFIVVFWVFILIFILTYFLQRKAKIYRLERREINIWITAKFVKILMAKFEILQNDKTNKELEFINCWLAKHIELNGYIINYNITTDLLIKLLIDSSKVFIIIMFWIWFWNNTINFWEFLSLMSIIYILEQILNKFSYIYIEFTKIFVDVEKLWDFFDTTPEIKWYNTWEIFSYKKWEIIIENLSYWYSEDKKVFNKFDLKIKWWEVTAFIWNSWSWKSTLVKLIAWYIRANSWKIIIDDQELNKTSLKSYYKNIGYLTQDPSVFDGTILENLTYAVDRKLKLGELEWVLKQAKCEFIYDLENWIKTEIWERWIRLSWGQKQRLAIAKIFLKNPKIIILDEPTSALDSFSEEQITKAMHNLFKKRTVIIIAHRLQTVKDANEIILFENGEIKERGTHKELVKLKGKYNKMLELQSGF